MSPAAAGGASAAKGRGSALPLGQAPAGLLSAGASYVCVDWARRRRKSSQDLSPLCIKRCCCVGSEFVMRRQGGDLKRPRKTLNQHKSLRECLSKCLFLIRYSWRVDGTLRTEGEMETRPAEGDAVCFAGSLTKNLVPLSRVLGDEER